MESPELSEAAEEALSRIWVGWEKGEGERPHVPEAYRPEEGARGELVSGGLVEEGEGGLSLTELGEREAAASVRRERLAERLLADVLNVGDSLATETACRFEHLLRRGLDDRICTLLGHPRACPHGKPIPPGPCCRAGADVAGKVVSALADLTPGQGGVIAYVHSHRPEVLQRLLAMGALPGVRVVLRQRFPSYVFDLAEAQVAIDAETARDIYLRLDQAREERSGPARRFRRRRRGRQA